MDGLKTGHRPIASGHAGLLQHTQLYKLAPLDFDDDPVPCNADLHVYCCSTRTLACSTATICFLQNLIRFLHILVQQSLTQLARAATTTNGAALTTKKRHLALESIKLKTAHYTTRAQERVYDRTPHQIQGRGGGDKRQRGADAAPIDQQCRKSDQPQANQPTTNPSLLLLPASIIKTFTPQMIKVVQLQQQQVLKDKIRKIIGLLRVSTLVENNPTVDYGWPTNLLKTSLWQTVGKHFYQSMNVVKLV
ncbi:hypothetical protein TSAR_016772 [Trichomalopsis sarcophagae]|uniref:Uncharacterized protein n=1 Tax=Trichomalopsis sarcophagae TaxID=543379 RepID=A0A232EF98_9HYME|nr:hypothetical protein TSAR_016772 [Trichomalopsis sarcophagae]